VAEEIPITTNVLDRTQQLKRPK